jgi:hypothetical protein
MAIEISIHILLTPALTAQCPLGEVAGARRFRLVENASEAVVHVAPDTRHCQEQHAAQGLSGV